MATCRIVILGGGFGGTYAALQFEKTLAKRPDVEVALISRGNYLLFTPMLHEVAAPRTRSGTSCARTTRSTLVSTAYGTFKSDPP